MKVTVYKNADDANARQNEIVVEADSLSELYEKMNRDIAPTIPSFYSWGCGDIKDGSTVVAMTGCWD